MPPLLRTYFNPSHRSFLQTLFTATFLASVVVVTFPCPVRKTGLENAGDESKNSEMVASRVGGKRGDVVVMINEKRRGKGRFMEED